MWLAITLVVFVVVLAKKGRLGPFVWERDWRGRPALWAPMGSAVDLTDDSAERILARRLADGDLTVDDYYERLSLIQAR